MSLQIIEMKVADLVPYAMNAKQHPAEQVTQIAASIEEFGMNDPVAVWHDADGVPIIVEGHGRVLALQKLKRKTCPVICLALNVAPIRLSIISWHLIPGSI